jgi:hypothetical protein
LSRLSTAAAPVVVADPAVDQGSIDEADVEFKETSVTKLCSSRSQQVDVGLSGIVVVIITVIVVVVTVHGKDQDDNHQSLQHCY